MKKNGWGGARLGAGRKKTSPFVAHAKRPTLDNLRKPVKITFRLRSPFSSLQNPAIYSSFHRASLRARGFGLRVLHYIVLPRSLQMICEFSSQKNLESSLKSLSTALAIALKKQFLLDSPAGTPPHRGPVFLGRFMMEILESPEHLRMSLRDMYLETLKDVELLETSSACLFQRWNYLLHDESREYIHQLPNFIKKIDAIPELPTKRIAREITASPLFALSRSLEKFKGPPAFAAKNSPESSFHPRTHRKRDLEPTA